MQVARSDRALDRRSAAWCTSVAKNGSASKLPSKGQPTGPLGPDADAVLSERGAVVWLRTEIFAGQNVSLGRYQTAELRMRRWGL